MQPWRHSRYLTFRGPSRASSDETYRGTSRSHRETLSCSLGVGSALGRTPIPLQQRSSLVPRPAGGMRNSRVPDDEYALESTCRGVN